MRRQKEEEDRKEAEERKRNFIKKKVLIDDIVKIKEQRIVRVPVEGEKKKIQDITDDDIETIDIATFEMLLETTKAKVLSDTENRFKKKFNLLHYFERERRDLLDPIISQAVKKNEGDKKAETIEVSKLSFEENQKLKGKIQEIAPEVVTMQAITEIEDQGSLQQGLRAVPEGAKRVQKHFAGPLQEQHNQQGQGPQRGGEEEERGRRKKKERFRSNKPIRTVEL